MIKIDQVYQQYIPVLWLLKAPYFRWSSFESLRLACPKVFTGSPVGTAPCPGGNRWACRFKRCCCLKIEAINIICHIIISLLFMNMWYAECIFYIYNIYYVYIYNWLIYKSIHQWSHLIINIIRTDSSPSSCMFQWILRHLKNKPVHIWWVQPPL